MKSVTVRTYDSQDALAMAVRTGEVDAMYDYASPIARTLAQSVTGVENVANGMSKNLGNYMLLFGFKQAAHRRPGLPPGGVQGAGLRAAGRGHRRR